MASFSHCSFTVEKSQMRRRPGLRRLVAGAASLLSLELAACEEPATGPVDGDGGVSSAKGRVAVRSSTVDVPPLLASVSLSLGALEARSDREPETAPSVTLGAPLVLGAVTPTAIAAAPPATYGGLRIIALDALTVTTITGNTLVLDFPEVAPIVLRCAGPGTYLGTEGEIGMDLSLDFSDVQAVLAAEGLYPPPLPTQTVTDAGVLEDVLAALEVGIAVSCDP